MSRRRAAPDTSHTVVRTDSDVTVGMNTVQVGNVQTGVAQTNSGQVVVYDPTRPPAGATPVKR